VLSHHKQSGKGVHDAGKIFMSVLKKGLPLLLQTFAGKETSS
jgi:hypothetical protein